jgi:hypothetical protein
VVTTVGPFVPPPPHVRIRRRAFGQNRPVIAGKELVPEASIYDDSAPPLESIPIGSTSSFFDHGRGLVSLDHPARIEGSAHHSLDSIPLWNTP